MFCMVSLHEEDDHVILKIKRKAKCRRQTFKKAHATPEFFIVA